MPVRRSCSTYAERSSFTVLWVATLEQWWHMGRPALARLLQWWARKSTTSTGAWCLVASACSSKRSKHVTSSKSQWEFHIWRSITRWCMTCLEAIKSTRDYLIVKHRLGHSRGPQRLCASQGTHDQEMSHRGRCNRPTLRRWDQPNNQRTQAQQVLIKITLRFHGAPRNQISSRICRKSHYQQIELGWFGWFRKNQEDRLRRTHTPRGTVH